MASRVLLLLLIPSLALGVPCKELPPDAPCAETISAGAPAPHQGWFYSEAGKSRVDEALAELHFERTQLRGENASLRTSLGEMEKKPAFTWSGALLLIGVGAVLGASVAIPVALVARK